MINDQIKKILFSMLIFSFQFVSAQQIKTHPVKTSNPVPARPFIIGFTEEIQSSILGEKRLINVYFPEGYSENDTVTYPVIYLLDGSSDEDFIHIAGLVQYNSFEWVNRIPKSILIGIANVDRKRDFTFPSSIEKEKTLNKTSGHSEKFIQFIGNELIPFVNKKYKSNKSSTLIGQSLGGLLATEILLKHTSLFNNYIIISPSLWWNNASMLEFQSHTLESIASPVSIYIGVGKEGLTPTDLPRVMEVDANLLYDKIQSLNNKHLKLIFDYLSEENHATIMHQAVLNAFKKLYQ